jgi:hypothetical protein
MGYKFGLQAQGFVVLDLLKGFYIHAAAWM